MEMKTLEDFKGTREPIAIVKTLGIQTLVTNKKIATIHYQFDQSAEANAKLFANSYKLLKEAEKAKKFLEYANNNSRKTETSEFWQELLTVKMDLEQAIKDCL